jgi:ATP synthase protein I
MSAPDPAMLDPAAGDHLLLRVKLEAARDKAFNASAEPAVAARLAQIGVLGWMIVTPILIGIFTGRWLDRISHSGLFYTAPLLMLGAAIGLYCAWRWMQRA